MTNIRFHLIALSIIIAFVLVVFYLSGQFTGQSQEKGQAASERTIKVWEASWGLNCQDAPLKDPNAALSPQKRSDIKKNNVLERVRRMCDGQVTCQFKADKATLGDVAPDRRCSPELSLIYRCYELDRPWQIRAENRQQVVFSCRQPG